MAQASFDIVSEIDRHELANALDQAKKEIMTRFDFKGTGTEIAHQDDSIVIKSSSEGRVTAALEVLKDRLVKRKISLKSINEGPITDAAGGNFRMTISLVFGIDDEKGRAINKFIKGLPVKAQSQLQGEQLRVSSKNKDDLQAVITALKEQDFGIPLQFTNYR